MSANRAFRSLLNRESVESELDAELRSHIEMEVEDLVRNGMGAEEARRQASIAFGGVQQTKEAVIEGSTPQWIEDLRRDLHIAFRSVKQHRTFSIAAIIALALAISANTTMFSIIDGMLNPPASVRDPERLYEIRYYGDPQKRIDPREREHAVTSIIGTPQSYTEWEFGSYQSIDRGTHANDAYAVRVRPNFFRLLGIKPVEGNIEPSPDNTAPTVVISTRLRALFFKKGESAIGQSIFIDGVGYTVTGVISRQYDGIAPLSNDAWVTMRVDEIMKTKLVRLPDGVSPDQMLGRLNQLAKQLALSAGSNPADTRLFLRPVNEPLHAGNFHYALMGAGLAILLVACTNLANLQLARGLTRTAELAIRSSLGASRKQIVTQLLLESSILAAGALIAALFLAYAGNALVRAYVPPQVGNYIIEAEPSWRMLPIAGISAVICLLAIGLFPAWHISRVDLNTLIKGRAGTGTHKANRRIYSALVVVQVALTLPLMCAAGLFTLSAWRSSDLGYIGRRYFGYDPRPVINITIPFPADSLHKKISYSQKIAEIIAQARAVPGVVAASATFSKPLPGNAVTAEADGGGMHEFLAEPAGYRVVTPDYFKTYGYRVRLGRDFQDADTGTNVVIVDDRTVERLWPQMDPIGRTIRLGSAKSNAPLMRVIGVVTHDQDADIRDLERSMHPNGVGDIHRLVPPSDSITLSARSAFPFSVRVADNSIAQTERLRQAFAQPGGPFPKVITDVQELGLDDLAITLRFMAGLFSVFATIGLGLSILGLYALVSQSVLDRRREVAVRVALGATSRKIIYSLLREGNVLLLAGIAIGLALTKLASGVLTLFIEPEALANAPLFVAICISLFIAMFLSALVPAARATRMNTMDVLRAE